MQLKIIIILSGFLAFVLLGFQTYRLGIANKTIKTQDSQINIMQKQTLNIQADLVKYNDEIINKDKENANFKIKNKKLKANDCAIAIISDDAVAILHQITSQQ